MQLDAQIFLELVEKTGKICFFDLETQGKHADYGGILVGSIKPFNGKPYSFSIKQVGNDKGVVNRLREELEGYLCWVTYYGKGFDIPFLNTRLLKWGMPRVRPTPHVDLFFTLKANTLTGRRSQAHLLRWFGAEEQKMSVNPDEWATIGGNVESKIKIMIARCESDVTGLEELYKSTKHLVRDIDVKR